MVTSKQRVLDAVNHTVSDRTPITFDAEKEVFGIIHSYLGTNTKEDLFDRLNVDTWMILPDNFIYPKCEEGKIEKTSIWGYRTKTTQYSGGIYDELCLSPLAGKNSLRDIDNHP